MVHIKTVTQMNLIKPDCFPLSPDVFKQLTSSHKKVIEGNQDRIYLITGREGLGKTTLALQLAYTLDNTFCLDDVVFTSDDFEKRIREVNKYKAVVFDEAFNGLSSKGALSKQNKRLVRLLMECRQRNLFIFIVLPSIFLLEKYIALFRSTALFNVLASKKDYKRRYYKIYNYEQKRVLYLLGKNLMDYSKPYITKSHRFYNKFPPTITEQLYIEKKHNAFLRIEDNQDEQDDRYAQRDILLYILNKEVGYSQEKIAERLKYYGNEIDRSWISKLIANINPKNR